MSKKKNKNDLIQSVPLPEDSLLTPGARWFLKEIDEAPVEVPWLKEMGANAATAYTDDGKMLFLVPPEWKDWDDKLRVDVLNHEAGHVAGGHDVRRKDRDKLKWNMVCDCAIHYTGAVSQETLEKLGGLTYEQLGLPPVPPEIAYDMLPENGNENGNGGEGCGRDKASARYSEETGNTGQSGRAKSRKIVAATRGSAVMGNGSSSGGSGGNRPIPEVIPNLPEWMQEILHRLKKCVSTDEPSRRWVRETRLDVDPIMMPGKAAKLGVAATFIFDASGSISEETLAKFLGAVICTPELQNSEVIVFDDKVKGPAPIKEFRELLTGMGGGTLFIPPSKLRKPGIPVVWLTDGYTNDGWPKPHQDADEFWVISTDVQPPHGIRIQGEEG